MCNDLIFFGGGGGTVATGVLQIAGGVALDSTLRFVEDQNGTDSAMQLSTTGVNFGTGTLTANGVLTVKGAGGNIASFRDSSNVEMASITNAGLLTLADGINCGNTASAPDVLCSNFYPRGGVVNFCIINFNQLSFNARTVNDPSLVATNTPPTLSAKDATNTNLIPFSAEDFTSANLSAGTLTTARPVQFGDKGTVATGNDLGLDAQIAVEHNGNIYYIPCSTSLIS
jgi:hypothetical protein